MAHDDLLDLKAERDDWQQPAKRNVRNVEYKADNGRKGSGGIFSIIVCLVLALLLAGMGYWVADQFDKVYDQFERTNQQLNLLSQRVQVLEGKLDVSNDSMASSAAAVRATLKEHDSEIRKLWGVSYDRNRKTINKQSDEIAELKKVSQSLKSGVNGLKSDVNGFKSNLNQVTKDVSVLNNLKVGESLAALETKLLTVAEQVSAFSEQLNPLLPKLEQYDESIVRHTKQLKELNDELIRSITDIQIQLNDDSLDKEVNKLSKLIDSIDKNRSRVNAELVKLSSKVNDLQKKMSAK